jgi:Trypsin
MRLHAACVIMLLSSVFWPLGCASPRPHATAVPPPPTPVTAAPVDADPVVGAVFLGASDVHTCTAAVLHSTAGNLMLTAAHCLASGYPTTFASGFNGQAGPAWTVDAIYLDPRWVAIQDPIADYAIARVSRPDVGSLESQVGSGLTLGAAPAAGTAVTVTAYPLGQGGAPIGCHARTQTIAPGYPSVQCTGLLEGTSGAPWRTDSTVVGLVGGLHGGGCDEKVSYSPPFDGRIIDLLHRAEGGGPSDIAPEVFENDC